MAPWSWGGASRTPGCARARSSAWPTSPRWAARHSGLTIRTAGNQVTLTLTGAQPAGPVLFQLPAFVGNIARTSAGVADEKTGTVTLAPTVRTVTVQLRHSTG